MMMMTTTTLDGAAACASVALRTVSVNLVCDNEIKQNNSAFDADGNHA